MGFNLKLLFSYAMVAMTLTGCEFGNNHQFFEQTPDSTNTVTTTVGGVSSTGTNPTPTATPTGIITSGTATPTATPVGIGGSTPTPTATPIATSSATPTPRPSATITPTPTGTPVRTTTPTPTATPVTIFSPTPTPTPVRTVTPTPTPTVTATPSASPSASPSTSPSATPSGSPTSSVTPTPTPICVQNPTAPACNKTPTVTTPGVVTILFTMQQIPQTSGSLILANAIKYASPVAKPKILFMKDSATDGEDEGDPAYIKNTLLAGYNVTYGVIIPGGLSASDVAGYDLVMVSNPGHPLSDAKTLTTLTNFAGGVILVGDDLSQGAGFSIQNLTGLIYHANGTSMTCNGKTYNYDNENGYKYQVSMNSEFLPGISAQYMTYQYGNDLDWTTAIAGVQVLATASAAANTCNIGQIPAIVRHPK